MSILGILNSEIGNHGGSYIDDTSATTPDSGYAFFAIQALEETVVNAVVGSIDISGATLPQGAIVYGDWSSITLTSGTCIAYQKVND